MNHRRQFLLLSQAGLLGAAGCDQIDYSAMQVRRGQFGRVARQRSGVQAIEPAGAWIVPRSIVHDLMIVDAVLSRLGKSPVGDLKHADSARPRTINFKRVPGPTPAPIGAGDRIPAAFDLRQSGEEFRSDNARGMLLEQGSVTLPGRFRALCQCAADGREELAGLAHDLIDPVERKEARDPKRAVPDDRGLPVEAGDSSGLSGEESNTAIDGSLHAKSSTWPGHYRSRPCSRNSNGNQATKWRQHTIFTRPDYFGSSGLCVDNTSRPVYFVHHEEHEEQKVPDNQNSELRALRVLRGGNIFTVNPEERLF